MFPNTIRKKSYARIPDVLELPQLIEVQLQSFQVFREEGLQELFDEISPIVSFNKNLELHLHLFLCISRIPLPTPFLLCSLTIWNLLNYELLLPFLTPPNHYILDRMHIFRSIPHGLLLMVSCIHSVDKSFSMHHYGCVMLSMLLLFYRILYYLFALIRRSSSAYFGSLNFHSFSYLLIHFVLL